MDHETAKEKHLKAMAAFKKYTEESTRRENHMIEQFGSEIGELKNEVSDLKQLLSQAVRQMEQMTGSNGKNNGDS